MDNPSRYGLIYICLDFNGTSVKYVLSSMCFYLILMGNILEYVLISTLFVLDLMPYHLEGIISTGLWTQVYVVSDGF